MESGVAETRKAMIELQLAAIVYSGVSTDAVK